VVVYRDDVCGVLGYHLLVPMEGVVTVWEAFVREGAAVRAMGWAAFNTARIEAGRPLFGVDFDETILPAETSQINRAVSFTKGCYLGQEVVARMHARNQVAKRLVGFRMKADALPLAGAPILDGESNTVGVVTSSTVSPVLSNAAIGLGYVKKPLFAAGTGVRIPAEGGVREAEVVEVPFVR
jgi:folate-binding protein YgfZ